MTGEVAVMTVRLDQSLMRKLGTTARVDDMSISEAVRIAVAEYVQRRQVDPAFAIRLRQWIKAMEDTARELEMPVDMVDGDQVVVAASADIVVSRSGEDIVHVGS